MKKKGSHGDSVVDLLGKLKSKISIDPDLRELSSGQSQDLIDTLRELNLLLSKDPSNKNKLQNTATWHKNC